MSSRGLGTLATTCALAAALAVGGCGGKHERAAGGAGHAGPSLRSAALFLSPNGFDEATCSHAEPCLSFDRAYRLARPGQVVEVAAGSYAGQTVSADPAKRGAASDVVFRPAQDARVTLGGELAVFGSRVEFQDMRVRGWYAKPGADHVTFRNIESTAGAFVTSASNVSAIGGSVGPGVNYSPEIKDAGAGSAPPRRILFDGVTFHDWTRNDNSSHVDCLHVMTVDGFVLRNSRFRNCEIFDVLFTRFGTTGSPRNVVVENNFLSCCRSGYYSLLLASGHGELWSNFLIRNNSTDKPMTVGDGSTRAGSRVVFRGNIGPYFNKLDCRLPGVSWDYDVWGSGGGCGPHDIVAPAGFADPRRLDFHLRPGAAALGHGDPTSHPARDIDGQPRPAGRPDAGADQMLRSSS